MFNVRLEERNIFITEDGREFDDRIKANAHAARLVIRRMVEDEGVPNNASLDDVVAIICGVGIYIPVEVWEALRDD